MATRRTRRPARAAAGGLTPRKRDRLSAAILQRVSAGASVQDALDAVLGSGTYKRLAGDVYDSLRRRRSNPTPRRRASNPRRGAPRPAYYTITAYKPRRVDGERVLREWHYTGTRFSRSSAGVVKFPTRDLAAKFARYLKRLHRRALSGYRLRVS